MAPFVRTRSRELQQRAERLFPGGVNSPVRAFRAVGGAPPFIDRAEGAYLYDADGNRYIDYFGSWGPMILGHAFPPVVEAIERAARNSASFGASTAAEADLAERIAACYPAIEKMRFVSSGTEATMSAIRLARAATGRKHHRQIRRLLSRPRRRPARQSRLRRRHLRNPRLGRRVPKRSRTSPSLCPTTISPRSKLAFAAHPDAHRRHHRRAHRGQRRLHSSRARLSSPACASSPASHGALLIVDEVMTGFRVALGGACELYSLDPRPRHARKDCRRRPARRRLRRQAPLHGSAGASRAGLPGRNAQRQSARHGRRHRHHQLSPGARRRSLPPPRSHLQSGR